LVSMRAERGKPGGLRVVCLGCKGPAKEEREAARPAFLPPLVLLFARPPLCEQGDG